MRKLGRVRPPRAVPVDAFQQIRCALGRWTPLTRFCEDGALEIDNNAAERRAYLELALRLKGYLSKSDAPPPGPTIAEILWWSWQKREEAEGAREEGTEA